MDHTKHRSNESTEDYLETILSLQKRLSEVRAIDIVREMNFSKPSVSVAMKNLRERGYIDIDESGHITLTKAGRTQAEHVLEKHTILSNWLISLGVDPDTALEDACRMEHDISEESFLAIKNHIHAN
ncbi:MAG: metal-dependent transcriptional regulator [Lachnospiraceae bacterium]|nr:metal-dependent transcriptional regulator [Lachnospiraceae bacterium]